MSRSEILQDLRQILESAIKVFNEDIKQEKELRSSWNLLKIASSMCITMYQIQ